MEILSITQPSSTLTTLMPFMGDFDHKNYFVGSRAIGCASPKSDWDFAFYNGYRTQITELVEEAVRAGQANSFVTSNKTGSIKFNCLPPEYLRPLLSNTVASDHLAINFIFLNASDLKPWEMATACMRETRKLGVLNPSFHSKHTRVKLFVELVKLFGGNALDLGGNSSL